MWLFHFWRKMKAAQFEVERKVTSPNRRAWSSSLSRFRTVVCRNRLGMPRRLLTTLSSALEHGKNVAVHCRQGIGRSGLIAAGLLVMSGMGIEKAIDAVSAARGRSIPETSAQFEWFRRLPTAERVSRVLSSCVSYRRYSEKVAHFVTVAPYLSNPVTLIGFCLFLFFGSTSGSSKIRPPQATFAGTILAGGSPDSPVRLLASDRRNRSWFWARLPRFNPVGETLACS